MSEILEISEPDIGESKKDEIFATDFIDLEIKSSLCVASLKRNIATNTAQGKKCRKLLGMKAPEIRALVYGDSFKFCQEYGLYAKAVTCYCGSQMKLIKRKESTDGFRWRCRKGSHNSACSVRKGTWFEKSKVPVADILWIGYMWVYEYSYQSMLHESGNSPVTLVEYCNCCRDLCQPILESKCDPLGGRDKLVEVFECKYEKGDKFERDRRWVFCAVQQFSTNTLCIVTRDKKSNTIVEILDRYILPGTTIFSNAWHIYASLDREDFEYLVNEKFISFFDSTSKEDLDTYEDFRAVCCKPSTAKYSPFKNEYGPEFCEYMYRKSLAFASDAFLAFINDVSKIYAPPDKVANPSSNK